MFDDFYDRYETEEREAVVLIRMVLGAGRHQDYWVMSATTLGMVFCDDGETEIGTGRLEWPVTDEDIDGDMGWGMFHKGQICRIRVRRMSEEHSRNLVMKPWCVTGVIEPVVSCPRLKAVLEEYNQPVVLEDEGLGTLRLNRDFDVFEGKILWAGNPEHVVLSLEVDSDDHSTWDDVISSARELMSESRAWDKAMRSFSAKALTELANQWLSDDEGQDADPVSEEDFAGRICLSELTVAEGGEFTAYYDDDDMFWGHAIEVTGSLENGVESANICG